MQAPFPENEAARLEALCDCKILDTPAEDVFDDLTRLAAQICDTPTALISLVDAERQWFKSKVGLEATETSRNIAFCAYTILQRDSLVVPDALEDERFATNPLVIGAPHIRFYAGVPLLTADGYALGTLCVIDYVPKELKPEQLEGLHSLGRQVVRQIQLRRNLAELARNTFAQRQAEKGHKRFFKRILVGFGAASAIVVGIGVVSYRSINQLNSTSHWVEHTQVVLNQLEEMMSQLTDAETGQRGYIITGKDFYLDPYRTATQQVYQNFQELRQLTVDNPKQQQRLKRLEPLMNRKLAFLKETISIRKQQGFTAAAQLIDTDEGQQLMNNIRLIVHQMKNEEKVLLQQRTQRAATHAQRAILTFCGGIFLNLVVLAGVYKFIHREITERKSKEAALELERNFTSAVLDTAGALVIVLDPQGQIVRFNRACEQTTGYSFEEVQGKYFWDVFLLPEEVPSAKETFKKLQVNLFSNQYENYWLTKDGNRRLIAWSNTTLLNPDGSVKYIISTGIDITERKRIEEVLRESEERFQAFMNHSPALAFMKDAQGRYVYINKPGERQFNIKLSDWLGKTDFDIWPEEIAKNLRQNDTAVLTADKAVEVIETVPTSDGQLSYWLSFKFPFKDLTGQQFVGGVTVNITERQQAEVALQEANQKLSGWVNELEQRNHEIAMLSKISDILQSCLTLEEAYSVIGQLVQPLFPDTDGGIFLISDSKNLVEAVTLWGADSVSSQKLFSPYECWSLRRGRSHFVEDSYSSLFCKHLRSEFLPTESLCVPMMAQGEALGMLYLSSSTSGQITEIKQRLATTVAEQIALALANLKLRETLQNQSIRDPLTGLFNRRYMEESLTREIRRTERKQQPLSIIMIDVDHFKRFNDTFGHEAGDAVLRELGKFLKRYVRESDIACRYGGEELTLILPESSLEVTVARAEQIREGAKQLNVQHRRQSLGAITLSLGVACFPQHGLTGEAVIHAADAALYQAKAQGRDRVISAT